MAIMCPHAIPIVCRGASRQKFYTREAADEAVRLAGEVVEMVRQRLKGESR
jgi:HEPN domain-containing protein